MRAHRADVSSGRVHVRPFVKTDLPQAILLDRLCFPPMMAYSKAEMQHFVSRPHAYAVVGERAGRMAGLFVGYHNARQREGLAHVITIDVLPSERRHGVATLLMEDAEEHYLQLGLRGMQLEVAVNNEAAQRFYLKRNFVLTGVRRRYYGGMLDAFTMRKVWAAEAE